MDRREKTAEKAGYLKDLEESGSQAYDDTITDEEGNKYRMPYRNVKEAVITGISKDELIDMPHAARVQYRLLLMDAVIRAKVEFVKGRITIFYNPRTATNRKEKISLEELIEFLAKEGIHVDKKNIKERDIDYYEEIYKTQFNPKEIRDHPPYGVSMKEWKEMKPKWKEKVKEGNKEKLERFLRWQKEYEQLHPEVFGKAESSSKKSSE